MMQAATLLVTLLTLLATRPRRSKMRCAMTSTTSRPRPRASPRSACSRWTMMTLKLKSRPSSQMQLRNRGRADISQIGSACPHVPAMFLTVALAQDEVEKTVRAFCAEQKCVLFVHSTLIPVRLCRSSPEKQPLLLSLPAAQPKASLEKLAQLALNTLRAPHVLLVPSPVLEAVSPGSAPSVVIELSARVCSVVSLKLTNSTMRRRIQHDGDPSGQRARSCICHRCAARAIASHARAVIAPVELEFGASDLTDFLMKIMAERGYSFSTKCALNVASVSMLHYHACAGLSASFSSLSKRSVVSCCWLV